MRSCNSSTCPMSQSSSHLTLTKQEKSRDNTASECQGNPGVVIAVQLETCCSTSLDRRQGRGLLPFKGEKVEGSGGGEAWVENTLLALQRLEDQ